MDLKLGKELTEEERAELKAVHDRIRKTIIEYASLLPTEAHIFLNRSFHAISKDDKDALGNFTKILKIEKMLDVFPYVWEALMVSKDKWGPTKETPFIDDPQKMLGYVRSIVWRLHNANKDDDDIADSFLLDIMPLDDETGEPLSYEEVISDDSTDFQDLDLWLTIEQKIRGDKSIKPERAEDMLDLIKARVFYEATRNTAHESLGWDQKKVEAVWKEIQRKGILEKIHSS